MNILSQKELERRKKSQGLCAEMKFNGDFFSIKTWSGHGATTADPQGAHHLLPPDAQDEVLGEAVQDALSKSRFLSIEEAYALSELGPLKERYTAWIQELMQRYGYKTKTALFKRMQNVSIRQGGGSITFTPMHHEKLEGWCGMRSEEDVKVVIPVTSSPTEIGAALRLALGRCTGKGAFS